MDNEVNNVPRNGFSELIDAGYEYNSIVTSGLKYEPIAPDMIVHLGKKPIEV